MKKKSIWRNDGVQTLLTSLLCIVVGLLIGFIVLLFINAEGAWGAIKDVMRNFIGEGKPLKGFGITLVKTAPLLMCSLSILFSYKVGLFNIGAAGQYVAGSCAAIYAALAWGWHWTLCMLFAIVAGAVFGAISGFCKAYFNVNEVISGIMLNWIGLYLANMILANVKEGTSPYTVQMKNYGKEAILPTAGLNSVFGDPKHDYIGIAIPIALLLAVVIYIILNKTKFGYELRATGANKNAAKYAGMAEKRNIIVTLAIGGALAGLGGSLFYQTGYEQWSTTLSSVPAMGFNGIAAAFLGGLNPIGAIFSSYFIQHITDGGANLSLSAFCPQISSLISSLIVYLCGFVGFLKLAMKRSAAKRDERAAKLTTITEMTTGGDTEPAAKAEEAAEQVPETVEETAAQVEDEKGGEE
ncbi:MAG: ABC transporter permease [Lachnospiraceae bacterium]|nr:ABC transporter permease [Lachnospiraceae bacterium]